MRAIVVEEYGGPEVMKLQQQPQPKPAKGEVLVKVSAAGVNPVDTDWRSGSQGYGPQLPFVPGLDGAGTVAELGDDVSELPIGTPVCFGLAKTGTYAEYCLVAAENCLPLPEHMSHTAGAAIFVPYATAWQALAHKAMAKPGETLFVHGASGGVGLACLQFARILGLDAIGSAGSKRGEQLILANGASKAVRHGQSNYQNVLNEIFATQPADIIVEMLGDKNLAFDLDIISRNGRIVIVGSRGEISIAPRHIMRNDVCVSGMSLLNAKHDEMASIRAVLRAGLEQKYIRPHIRRQFPLSKAAEAHTLLMQAGAAGKIVLTISPA
jgi:NADPH2:quinone reductase